MSTTFTEEAARSADGRPRHPTHRRRARSRRGGMSYLFVAGHAALTLAFGVLPALYALYLAFTTGTGGFAGLDNFTKVIDDFRFLPAVGHVALYLVIWLVALVVLVTVLALVVHAIRVRWLSRTLRLVFYLPGAVAGASSVLLWLFVLDPTVSPVAPVLRLLGYDSFLQVIAPSHLPPIFAIIAFWTGAGGWIVIMYGALNTISAEMIEAARIDGANVVQIAWRIQLPLLRKWISYMGIMSLAAGTQLFVEPQLLSQASTAVVPNDYSLNQLAYLYAFQQNDFNGAAAISLMLLLITLVLSTVFVTRGGLFETD
ncbi:carbohydrate ABC transporter permease [Virgisporangium aurantiacum]|uniref:Sugar ABC transporter permease n=1 Tax=Virgisporangium aurantiacum TaxID=175570 RepID=A0A8J4DYC5_9ACTN|nr:sugar ABC transporter permease [Virgisporangium aurantiacum]GIJ54298.1 sugar ABC transporter permease [Virgisporangium aurantiacum]